MRNYTRTANSYHRKASDFSNSLRNNGFRPDFMGYTFTEDGYSAPSFNDSGSSSKNHECYIVHSTPKKMLSVLFSHFNPTEIEQFYSFLTFGLKVIAETDINEKELYTFKLISSEGQSFSIHSTLFSLNITTCFSLTSLGFSLTPVVVTELSYANLMSAIINEFKLSLLSIIGDNNTVINDSAIRTILQETRIDHHLRNHGKHVKKQPFAEFVDNSLDFFLKDLNYSEQIGLGINSQFGYIYHDNMIGLLGKDNIKKANSIDIILNYKEFRAIKPLLKDVMNERDMNFLFSMFDMYLFKMNLQNNPNNHNPVLFIKNNIEKVPKSKTLDNNMEHFEFKFNDFRFKVSDTLFFTDFSGKGGYYTSKEDDFERMYIEYQKHIVKGVSAILKEPAEDINYRTLLLHFMSVI